MHMTCFHAILLFILSQSSPLSINMIINFLLFNTMLLFPFSTATSPRPISRAEAQRSVSRRLHRGVAPAVASADPSRRDMGRLTTPYTAMNGGMSGGMKGDMGRDDGPTRTASSRYLRK